MIHVNDIGTTLEMTVKDQDGNIVNISGASTMTVYLERPNGAGVLTRTAVWGTDGTDGVMKYVTVDGDLDQAGSWQMQGFVTIGGGSWHSDIVQLVVATNLG